MDKQGPKKTKVLNFKSFLYDFLPNHMCVYGVNFVYYNIYVTDRWM